MKRTSAFSIHGWMIWACLLITPTAHALQPSSYRLPHPLGWMHLMPVGEAPGWSGSFWIQTEVSHANIWNAPLDFYNAKNNKFLNYNADFEQTTTLMEMGFALTSFLAFSVEVPYASRGGGGLDQFIDTFHIIIGSDRFSRDDYDKNQANFSVKTAGVDQLKESNISGIGNVKYKLKLWWLKWLSKKPGACDCGLSTSVQVKVPTASAAKGLTSGESDYTGAVHLGIPLFQQSALWLTSATTYLSENHVFKDWPRKTWHQMYEMSLDMALNDTWGFLFQVRAESPFMEKHNLLIVDTGGTARERLDARIASGWNSLVHWRGSQGFGLRWRPTPKVGFNFIVVEDWGVGNFDGRGDNLYVNNAPDVAFVLQSHFAF